MPTPAPPKALAWLGAVLAIFGGCSKDRAAGAHAGVGADAGPESRAEVRCVARAGGQACSSVTVIHYLTAPTRSVRIDEQVWFDPDGRLLRAETWMRDEAGTPGVRVTMERRTGAILLERGPHRASWTEPTDAPWAYAPVVGPAGDPLPTPLAAWAVYRAAKGADAVRVLHPHMQRSFLVPRDQVATDGDGATTVVLADDAAEVDARFVKTVGARAAGLVFARRPSDEDGAFTFVVAESGSHDR